MRTRHSPRLLLLRNTQGEQCVTRVLRVFCAADICIWHSPTHTPRPQHACPSAFGIVLSRSRESSPLANEIHLSSAPYCAISTELQSCACCIYRREHGLKLLVLSAERARTGQRPMTKLRATTPGRQASPASVDGMRGSKGRGGGK